MVGVYHAEQAGMGDDPESRWVTVCETHHTLVSHPTLALARAAAPYPREWCEDCRPPEWTTDPVDRDGLAAYTVAIRHPDDPSRRDRARSLGGMTGSEEKLLRLKDLKKATPEEWRRRIVAHMADGEPRTFNRIGVELVDTTADNLIQSSAEDGLWLAVAAGELEHTLRAPILFRTTSNP